jgi:hypothetical protein
VFLADTVYVMSKSPGRFVVRREIDLPRPRDLEITYTPQFTDIVHELRGHIGAMRKAAATGQQGRRRRHEDHPQVERWSPWMVLVAVLLLWQAICARPSTSRVHLPEPGPHLEPVHRVQRPVAGSAWRTFWVTMVGFGIAIVVGVLLGFLIGSSRLAYAAVYPLMTGFNALPKAAFVPILVVWFGIGVGPAILTAFLISSSRSR